MMTHRIVSRAAAAATVFTAWVAPCVLRAQSTTGDVVTRSGASRSITTVRGNVALSAGTGTDQRGIRSNAQTLAPGLTLHRGNALTLGLGGAYTRYATGVSSLGAALGGAVQHHLARPLVIAVTATTSYASTSFHQSFAAASMATLAEVRVGQLAVYGGPRVQYGRTAFTRDASGSAWLPGPLGGAAPSTAQRMATSVHAVGALAGTQYTITNAARTRATFLGYRIEHASLAGISVTDHTASATLANSKGRASVSGGRRFADEENRPFASASVAWIAHPAFTFELTGGSYLSNRVSGALAGSFLQAGVSWSPNAFRGNARAHSTGMRVQPDPRGVAPPARGATRLVIAARTATRVTIAGDWNQWQEVVTARANNGVWYVDVPLVAGEYRYAFRVDGEWRVPEGAARIDDGFGGMSALVIVSGQHP